jgi:two-component sensor histidine kinase
MLHGYHYYVRDDKYLFYLPDASYSKLITISHSTGVVDSLNIMDYGIPGGIEYVTYDNSINSKKNKLYIYTHKYIMKFDMDSGIVFENVINTESILERSNKNEKIVAHTDRSVWDTCIAILTKGLYFSKRNINIKPSALSQLDNYKCIGVLSDSLSYWYRDYENRLVCVFNNKIIKQYTTTHPLSVALKNGSDSIFLGGKYCYYLNTKSDQLSLIFSNISGTTIRAMAADEPLEKYFVVAREGVHLINVHKPNDSFYLHQLDFDRYNGVVYDKLHHKFWAFNNHKILIYNSKTNKKETPPQIPTDKIEKICIDGIYGNIVVKGKDELFLFNPDNKEKKIIRSNINLNKCNIDIYKNTLIITGDFGVQFSKINGFGSISAPVTYYNFRKTYYRVLYSQAILNSILTLATDNGMYDIIIPSDSTFTTTALHEYDFIHHVILDYNNSTKTLGNNDTIEINQHLRSMELDVINPTANGEISYYLKLEGDSSYNKYNSLEITLPAYYSPDDYYTASLYCMDDGWKSDTTTITFYIAPYWWQTHTAKKIIWTGVTLAGILAIIISVLITRRLVTRANEKKNLQMELELKAIYAQINPHFIFNTLTSALLLVSKNRMDEAYTHISKFSKLLRSYLKSSRNKFITLADEIDNLKNYTELQQTRFKNRFDCDIIVDQRLDAEQVNIPSLLLQPFVENAINHGILSSEKPGLLSIEFISVEDAHKIVCIISDNGVGRQKSMEDKKRQEHMLGSYGNMMIKDLVGIFNKYEEMNIEIEYADKQLPETGTSVIITITYPDNKKSKLRQ